MPDDAEQELELRDYLNVLRRRKWTVMLTVLLVVGAALAASLLQTERYRATAELLLQPRASERIFSPADEAQGSNRQGVVSTEIQVMKSSSVRSAVAEKLGRAASVSIGAKGDTDVVTVSATSTDPEEAAVQANTYAEVYIATRRQQTIDDLLAVTEQVQQKVDQIDRRLSELGNSDEGVVTAERQALVSQRTAYTQQVGQLQLASNLTGSGGAQLVSRAEAPTTPYQPTPARNAVLAWVVGLLLGAGLAFLRDYLDDAIRNKDDLERSTGLTVIGAIPLVGRRRSTKGSVLVTETDGQSPTAESYRSLRTSLQFIGLDRDLRLIQVTSALAAEGKTTTIANLAVALSSAGQRVLLVDGDLRRPRLHEFFGLTNRQGLTSVLLGTHSLAEAAVPCSSDGKLAVLPSGTLPPNPSELLGSVRAGELFATLRSSFDVVLLDSPPVLAVSDALVLAGHADGTIVVARAGQTTKRGLAAAVERLRLIEAPLVGAVLNAAPAERGYGDSSYHYTYAAATPKTKTKGLRRSKAA